MREGITGVGTTRENPKKEPSGTIFVSAAGKRSKTTRMGRIHRPGAEKSRPRRRRRRLVAGKLLGCAVQLIAQRIDDLVAAGLAETVRHGIERRIHFKAEGRHLPEEATPLLRSPVRSPKFVRGDASDAHLKLAGETALSHLTELASPRIDTFAVAASDWKAISQTANLAETNRDEANCIIETWSYDPAALSDTHTVDVLSLYA